MIRNKIVKDDIIVRKSILHILNSGSGQIGLATNLIDMGPDLFDMIRNNVFKVLDNDERISCSWIKIHRLQRLLKISKKQMIRALSIRQEIWLSSCLISCVTVFRFRQQICFVLVFR